MRNKEAFGELLRAKRAAAGYSLRSLAGVLGLSASYLCDIEDGRRRPLGAEHLQSAAAALGVDVLELEKAAAVSRGVFELAAGPTQLHVDVGAELAGMWTALSASDLSSIAIHCAAARARRSRKAIGR